LHAGHASEPSSRVDNDDDDDSDDDSDGGSHSVLTLDFNLGTINRRPDIHTRLVDATLYLKKKLTRADNGTL